MMSNDTQWITARVAKALMLYPVPEAVSARMDELLNRQLSERQLSSKELTNIASLLIEDMIPASTKAASTQ